jgi:hypothetical protein
MASISPSDSLKLHEFLTSRPDLFTIVFPAITAIVGVLLGQGVEWLRQRSARRLEREQWLGDHFLSRKLDALSNFWAMLAEWHDAVVEKHSVWEAGKYDARWSEALAPFPGKCLRALRAAQPFLDPDQFGTFKVLCNRLELAGQQVLVDHSQPGFQRGELSERSRERQWSDLGSAYDKAVEQMGALFGRRLLKKVTK